MVLYRRGCHCYKQLVIGKVIYGVNNLLSGRGAAPRRVNVINASFPYMSTCLLGLIALKEFTHNAFLLAIHYM